MMRVLLFILIPVFALAQPPSNRYNGEIFPTIVETNDVLFSAGVPQPVPGGGFYEWITGYPLNVDEYDTDPVDLEMDIFEPSGDTIGQRPLIIICFGGGFLSGSKDHWSIRLLCMALAKRGYVTAAIDYRLGMNIFDEDLAARAVYRGVQDARSAVRFFRADAAGENTYNIDPDRIFLGGHSSGAFMAIHNAYMDQEIERPISTYTWIQDGEIVPDQECLDCVGNNLEYDGHANSIFSLAGAIGFLSFMESGADPNMVMFHSMDDGTVDYYSDEPFGSILWAVIGSDLPIAHGSNPMSLRGDTIGLPYDFYSYESRGHGVHENDPNLYDDIVPGINDWFFDKELKPKYLGLIGDDIVCDDGLEKTYSIGSGEGYYFDWNVEGGSFTSMSSNSEEVTVLWDEEASDHILEVVPYNDIDAKGDTLAIVIDIYTTGLNTYQKVTNNWSDISNWDLGHTPIACENVIFENAALPFDVIFNGDEEINSLTLGDNFILTLQAGSQLTVIPKTSDQLLEAIQNSGTIINKGTLIVD